jgi:hypothetical protein
MAAAIVEEALGRVFEPTRVGALRPDSPLAAVGNSPADAIGIADAISLASAARGLACELGDGDLADALTVADLVHAVAEAARPGDGP